MTPLSVLYVDDDADIRTIVQMALRLDGSISLRVAASGAEALGMITERPLPDLVMLDVMMPGMDGPTLLDELRAREETRTLPVIFMTAKARGADVARYHARGATGVIVKPFDPLTLAAQLRAVLAASDRGIASDG